MAHGIQNARRNAWTEIVQRNILKCLGLTISETFYAFEIKLQRLCFTSKYFISDMMRSFGADEIQLLLILDEAEKLGFQVDFRVSRKQFHHVPPATRTFSAKSFGGKTRRSRLLHDQLLSP